MGSSFFCSVDQTAIKSLHQNEAKVFRLLDQMKRKPSLQRCAAGVSARVCLKNIQNISPVSFPDNFLVSGNEKHGNKKEESLKMIEHIIPYINEQRL